LSNEFDVFRKALGDSFDKGAGSRIRTFKQLIGTAIAERLGNPSDKGIGRKKHYVMRCALRLSDTPRPEGVDLAKLFTNIQGGMGATDATVALYFLCHKLIGFEAICDDFDARILPLYDTNFWDESGRPTRDLEFESVVSGAWESVYAPRSPTTGSPTLRSFFSDVRVENDLHFSKHVVDVLGRDSERERLRSFLADQKPFLWLQLAGVGGQGKSRLAFDLVEEAKTHLGWDAGFMTEEGLDEFSDRWSEWQPDKPTLIVVDYILGKEKSVGRLSLARAAWHHAQKSCPPVVS
jgi:hypothetical protein